MRHKTCTEVVGNGPEASKVRLAASEKLLRDANL
jgi:hypothetical protein